MAPTRRSIEDIKRAVMADTSGAFLAAHSVAAEVQAGELTILDVVGLPIRRQWFAVSRTDRAMMPVIGLRGLSGDATEGIPARPRGRRGCGPLILGSRFVTSCQIFANESGRFVCATAGHKLECMLAAHGSGATALSKKRDACGLHVDIGGGTTKLALIDKGEIISVAAFAVGGRLLAQDGQGTWSRIDDSARIVAGELGIGTHPATIAGAETRRAIAKHLAAIAVDEILGEPLDALGERLLLTEPLERPVQPTYITFSSGVSEYIFDYETNDHGDIARDLASEIVAQLKPRIEIPIVDAGQRIRATVIGASQFTVQVSGKTLYMNGAGALPKHNIPVVHLGTTLPEDIDPEEIAAAFRESADRQDHDVNAMTALAFSWTGSPDYQRLLAMAKAIKMVAAPEGERKELLVLMIDGDIGQTIGRILDRELGIQSHLISIDGVRLKDLDFVDIGEFLNPPGVIPVVIKSLLFS